MARHFRKNEDSITPTDYGMIVFLIIIAIIGGVALLSSGHNKIPTPPPAAESAG